MGRQDAPRCGTGTDRLGRSGMGPTPWLEVQTRLPVFEALRRNRVQVALAEQHEPLTPDLDLSLVLGIEQDAV